MTGLRSGSSRGFALLITVTLLAFLVMILVSLSALTRVETQVATNTRQTSIARQNALMGLNVAIGRLQALSGPDQRVTATADLLKNTDDGRKRWTAVWHAGQNPAERGKNLGWLVSGATPDGSDDMTSAVTAGEDERVVKLVDENSADGEAVRVVTEAVKVASVPGLPNSATGHKVGSFAYWVGDEGVKAKMTLVDPHAEKAADERIYSFLVAQRNAGELVAFENGTAIGAVYPKNDEALRKVFAHHQLSLTAMTTGNQTTLQAITKNRFHDLTFNAMSLPANVATGGLKKDLTAWLSPSGLASGAPADDAFIIGGIPEADSINDRLPRWGIIRSFAGLSGGSGVTPRRQTDTEMGVYPIVTYVKLGIGLSCEGDGEPLKIHLFPEVVLWNPYNVPLKTGSLTVGLRLSGIIEFSAGGSSKTRLNLTRALQGPTNSWPTDYFKFRVNATEAIPAGESVIFTPTLTEASYGAADAVLTAESPPNLGGSFVMADPAVTLSETERALPISWTIPGGGNMHVALWPASSPAADTSDAYYAISQIGYGGTVPVPTAEPAPPVILAPRFQFRSQATMSRGVATHITSRWIAQQNMRAPLVDRSGAETGNLPLYYGGYGSTITSLAVDGNRAGAGLSVSRVAGSADRVVLHELRPAGLPLFSLAELQHANLALAGYYPGYAVGNSLPSAAIPLTDISRKEGGWSRGLHDLSHRLNGALWDSHFFSTVPPLTELSQAELDDGNYHLPNARHVFARSETLVPAAVAGANAFHSAAAHLWVDGGFNVNSTSVEAWKALLASRNGVLYDPVNASTGAALEYPFSRFAVPTGGANRPWEGYRSLSEKAITGLAEQIVEQIRARGPFLSLADFVNR